MTENKEPSPSTLTLPHRMGGGDKRVCIYFPLTLPLSLFEGEGTTGFPLPDYYFRGQASRE